MTQSRPRSIDRTHIIPLFLDPLPEVLEHYVPVLKAMAPHSSTLAWKIPWMEEPGRLQSMGSWGSDTTEQLPFHFSLWCIGEGNGNPLQCSCLENLRDRGAWWAAVYGVAQSRTRLKWLSSSSSSRPTIKELGKMNVIFQLYSKNFACDLEEWMFSNLKLL